MFKKGLLVSFMLLVSSPVFAGDSIPKWEEFCPSNYINAVYGTAPEYTTKKKDIILSALFGPLYLICKKVETNNQIKEVNYWADRKTAFDNEINTCLADESNQSLCFMKIRELELQKNIQLRNEQINSYNVMSQVLNNAQSQTNLNRNTRSLDGVETQLNNINTQLFLLRQ